MSKIFNICLVPVNLLQCSRSVMLSKNASRVVISSRRSENGAIQFTKVDKCHIQSFSSHNIALNHSSNFLKQKIDELVGKYEEITGMDEVRIAQNRVIEAQDKFVLAQEKRRELVKQLTDIQNKLKEVHAELDASTRGEERYLNLITKEHHLLKEERRLNTEFNLSEREERECFTFLSSAVKESHEKERAQAERTKYWSVIGSIVGTVIGVVGSSINNEFKMRELRKLVVQTVSHTQRSSEVDEMAANILTRHEEQLSQIVMEIKNISKERGNSFSRLLHHVDHSSGDDTLAHVQVLLEQQRQETRIAMTIAVVVIPIVVFFVNKIL
ncbi:mitochondrial potassium channel-like [Macrosteles quadrilineatus]|uniref:mitochondrial potassium channel-like n=1 Tax=Macrosteles quadrilineatus TaxID=74068 RepID=UPI0023E15A5C|nr:mitochondrial potassium channel-like [Macrosteles quadrilineatus]